MFDAQPNLNSPHYVLLDLPSKVEYALLALLEMASRFPQKTPVTVSEITAKQPIPDRYLEQILATLRRGGLLKSQRGARGGYVLARPPQDITLLEIVSLIEGDRQVTDKTDPSTLEMRLIRESWQTANLAAQSMLDQYTLQDLCQKRNAYNQENLMYYI
jgi:Rrf2 family protein